jgi:hypothetical protein
MEYKPHQSRYWIIPPKANAAFVAAMEDVLEVYTRPHDPARPLVCLDETSKQLTRETRTPLPTVHDSSDFSAFDRPFWQCPSPTVDRFAGIIQKP